MLKKLVKVLCVYVALSILVTGVGGPWVSFVATAEAPAVESTVSNEPGWMWVWNASVRYNELKAMAEPRNELDQLEMDGIAGQIAEATAAEKALWELFQSGLVYAAVDETTGMWALFDMAEADDGTHALYEKSYEDIVNELEAAEQANTAVDPVTPEEEITSEQEEQVEAVIPEIEDDPEILEEEEIIEEPVVDEPVVDEPIEEEVIEEEPVVDEPVVDEPIEEEVVEEEPVIDEPVVDEPAVEETVEEVVVEEEPVVEEIVEEVVEEPVVEETVEEVVEEPVVEETVEEVVEEPVVEEIVE